MAGVPSAWTPVLPLTGGTISGNLGVGGLLAVGRRN